VKAALPLAAAAIGWLGLVPSGAAAASRPAGARVALLVGANQPAPGRKPLRHAHRDAERMAESLLSVGRFAREHVHVLRDPAPAEVLALIDRYSARGRGGAQGGGALFYFYYSGHADDGALYPGGRALPLDGLRAALEGTGAAVRIGMLDACRGGAWTRTKGLAAEAPFEVQLPVNLGSEGSVLIASSSGLESAHESDGLQGSFFTHHFVAALRGAADKSENGEVTLSEAFEYAKDRTVRDTARLAREPQHPSYAVNLRGRQDLVLTQLHGAASTLALAQSEGPLEVIQLETGLAVLELSPGKRRIRAALSPGRYLVRRSSDQGYRAREVAVVAGNETRVDEAELVLVGAPALAGKGPEEGGGTPPAITGTTLPRRTVALGLALGVSTLWENFSTSTLEGRSSSPNAASGLALQATLIWGITDRLSWAIGTGAFAYRFGQRGGWELVPAAGIFGWGYSSVEGWLVQPGAVLGIRRWFGDRLALSATGGATTAARKGEVAKRWQLSGTLGVSNTYRNLVTFNFAGSAVRTFGERSDGTRFEFGAVQSLGFRTLPLIQIHLPRGFSLDLVVSGGYDTAYSRGVYSTLLGSTFVF
jgi:hypothetical protein